jgi:hypothetical protein
MAFVGGMMEEPYLRRLARLEVEERIVQIRYELAWGVACADGAVEFLGGRDLEEQLLDELTELELILLNGRYGFYSSGALPATAEWERG